jgi:hypothetical protein
VFPAFEDRAGVDRAAVDVDLEVEVTADGAGVAGLADAADMLAGPDALASMDVGGGDHVGVEVAAPLALAVDQEVVAVEDRVIAGTQHAAGRGGDERRVAAGDDVESFVGAAAIARRAEFADVAARPVRALDREDMGLELARPVAIDLCRRRSRGGEQREAEEEEAPQWCSMTRSTMLYSFASSAVMK